MFRHTLLFVALSAALPAQAQRDVYGRDVSAGRHRGPVEAAAPVPASPPASRGAAFTLLPYETRPTGSWADTVAIGDVTGDGRADVVLATSFYFDEQNDYHVFVFPQGASGTLLPPHKKPYHQNDFRTGIALGNFNGAGPLDVAVGADYVTLLYATAQAPWLNLGGFIGTTPAQHLAALDLDGVDRDDFVSVTGNAGVRYLADRFGGYATQPWGLPGGGYALAKGDLDGDAIDDLAVASAPDVPGWPAGIHAIRNHRDGTLSEIGLIPGASASGMGIGDVDSDGVADIVVSIGGNSPGSRLVVYRGTGGGQFGAPQELTSYDIPESLAVADMNLDGRDDVLVLHGGWVRLGVYLQGEDGTLEPERLFPIPYASHYNAQGLAVADFTGDGCPDVAIADYNNDLVTLRGSRCDTLFADTFEP
jgi:hypothetical protein